MLSITEFTLNNNLLTGTLPEFEQYPTLQKFSVSNNFLTGTIWQKWNTLENLVMFDVSYNNFHGDVQYTFDSNVQLTTIILTQNLFSGFIPNIIFAPGHNIEVALLQNNKFSGPIFTENNISIVQKDDDEYLNEYSEVDDDILPPLKGNDRLSRDDWQRYDDILTDEYIDFDDGVVHSDDQVSSAATQTEFYSSTKIIKKKKIDKEIIISFLFFPTYSRILFNVIISRLF